MESHCRNNNMSKKKKINSQVWAAYLFIFIQGWVFAFLRAPLKHPMKWIEASRIVNMKLQEIIFDKEVESHTFWFQKSHTGLFQDTPHAIEHKNL